MDFKHQFEARTGHLPFPWQEALYCDWFSTGRIPESCNLPTGLGKTNVIAVWLIALANGATVPRRLVYVVNRRTVVDQTTDEVESFRNPLAHRRAPIHPILLDMAEALTRLSSDKESCPLALSTLRGQFADNREWSADPSRPAVICGTVDMIGSRLLFSGYGIGSKAKPLHAGFLGQDVLLVHDEAHLEPAFQELLVAIEKEQEREPIVSWPKLRVMELTATSRNDGNSFPNDEEKKKNEADPKVKKLIGAEKRIELEAIVDAKKLADVLAAKALTFESSNKAVIIFTRTVDDVLKVRDKLPKDRVETLTGTMRGLERDQLVEKEVFKRFLPKAESKDESVYLVCTSAGEVGVNISSDHLVCDLSTFESMAQRFGRVNRFGVCKGTQIHIFHPAKFEDKEMELRRQRTLALLRKLNGDGSPMALGELPLEERLAAFAPTPTILPVTDIIFDAWALTTIKGKLPGRPPVEPYLHGLVGWEPPETQVAWREEVSKLAELELSEKELGELLDEYPLKPHELLREPSYRASKHFEAIAKRCPELPAWLVDDDGKVEVLTLKELADKDEKKRIEGKTVLLPPAAGGLKVGMLDGASPTANDVADAIYADKEQKQLLRLRLDNPDDERVSNMRLIRRIDFTLPDDDDADGRYWYWFGVGNNGEKSAKLPVLWRVHVDDVIDQAQKIVANLPLDQKFKDAIIVAALLHDHGKKRRQFQTVLNNLDYPAVVLAKSGKKGGRVPETYRHEFGSLLEVANQPEFVAIIDLEMKELVLHLIAAHHGRARPHFPADEAFDPEPPIGSDPDGMAASVPRRFAKLQRKYGRWGLAYLESLLRAADWAASANPSGYLTEDQS